MGAAMYPFLELLREHYLTEVSVAKRRFERALASMAISEVRTVGAAMDRMWGKHCERKEEEEGVSHPSLESGGGMPVATGPSGAARDFEQAEV